MRHRPASVEKQNVKNPQRTLRRLLPYFAPYKWRLMAVVLVLVVGTLANLLAPYLLGVAVDQFISPGGTERAPWLDLFMPADVAPAKGLSVLMGILALTYLISWVTSVIQFRLIVRVSQQVLLKMRSQILKQLHGLSLDFYEEHEAGDLMSRLTNDTQIINDMFGPGLMRVLSMTLSVVGIMISMVSLNWRLALASYTVLPLVLLLTAFFSKRVRAAYRETRKTIGQVSAELQENISGVREVQAFARESATYGEFRSVNAQNRSANVRAETISALFMPALDVLSTTASALVVGVGGYLVLAFSPPLVSVGVIVSFMTYVGRFYRPIREMANLYGQMQAAIAGAERIFELLDVKPSIENAPEAEPLEDIEGRIVYDRVSFAYEEDEPVLQDVSVRIEPGQTIALVGPTGAGKTTFVNLLMRFYDVQEGAILLDGRDLRQLAVESLRERIGVVPQDTYLFSTTVLENIRYGLLSASDEEVIQAAKVANAHEFIERLPKGYDTELGERGSTLSQGHRQLLAIARAVLNNPDILILDEATSSVDTRTEIMIQQALDKLMADRTSLVIAHRLSTIRNADQILVIQDGRIVERGRHEALLARGGVYQEMYTSQFRREEQPASDLSEVGAD